jgi:EpsD family peptidyl-prolyl cis-trans isomerase
LAAGCGKKDPTGQVAAVVGRQEVTTNQINQELAGFNTADARARKSAQSAALGRILARKVLADAARKAGIDKSPYFALKQQRANEELLVQSWQDAIAKTVPEPSREEVNQFLAAHPDVYGQHKVLQVEQIRMPRPTDPAVIKALEPMKSTAEVTSYLTAQHIEFRSATDRLDPIVLDPDAAERIFKLSATDMFALPAGSMILINHVVSADPAPLAQDAQVRFATAYLKQKHTQEAVARKFQSVLAASKKDIRYNKDFTPPAQPAAKSPASAPSVAAK